MMNSSRSHRNISRGAAAARLPASLSRRQARVVGWLVGLTLLVGGLGIAASSHASPRHDTPAARHSHGHCKDCGVVTAVKARQVKGEGSGLGVVGGAVVGGLLGNQVGKGTGNTVATVGGAVAGGFAGNEIEKQVNKRTVYKTTVRMADGSVRELTVSQQFAVGAKVRVDGQQQIRPRD